MFALLTERDVTNALSVRTFSAGAQYALSDRVETITIAADGTHIDSVVQGNAKKPYHQTIQFKPGRNGAVRIISYCTCPMRGDCKHVAAVLFEAMAEETALADAPLGIMARAPIDIPPPALPQQDIASPEIEAWLRSLDRAHEDDTEAYPPNIRKRLIYVFDASFHTGPVGRLQIDLASIEVLKSGSIGSQIGRHDFRQILTAGQQPKFLRPSDRLLIRRLERLRYDTEDLTDDEITDLLQRAIDTGRAKWGRHDGPPLNLGDPVQGQIVWRVNDDGTQRPSIEVSAELRVIALSKPWYFDPETGRIGPVKLETSPRVTRALLASPPVPPGAAARVRGALSGAAKPMPAPAKLDPATVVSGPPRRRITLLRAAFPADPYSPGAWPARPATLPVARLSFRYGPIEVPAFDYRRSFARGEKIYQVNRDQQDEKGAVGRLEALNFLRASHAVPSLSGHPHGNDFVLMDGQKGASWAEIALPDIDLLREEGWEVETAADFPIRLAQITGDIEADLAPGTGIDWFELGLGVMVDGQRVDLVPPLLKLIASGGATGLATATPEKAQRPLMLPLADGRLLALPMARIQPILATLLEIYQGFGIDAESGKIALSTSSAADLALIEAAGRQAGLVLRGGEGLRALGRQLRERGGISEATLPSTFVATLRPYQARGVDWLQFLREAGLGGVLADDMGLGKTVQALAHLAIEKAEGRLTTPALVICPTSLVGNWRAEAHRFAPDLRVLVLHGSDRAGKFESIDGHDLVITTYPLLARDHAVLSRTEWSVAVLDEAQTIKNPMAATSVLARTLHAGQRLCLSGTPMENHLGELWSLFDFLMPRFLGESKEFTKRFRTPIEKGGDMERRAVLARRVAPFLLRRTKEEVAPELPEKTEITETVEMEAAQRAIYEGIRLAMHARVREAIEERGLARSGIIILDALLKLRQACCDPRLLKLTSAKLANAESAKLERLMEMVPMMLEEGRSILLFSQFTSMLALIRERMDEAGIKYELLTGDTKDRATPVARFQAGDVKLFLVSLKAGGVGLNLTAADTVIHYDPWWNPAVEDQATDRAHRIGQTRAVFVHRLITAGTIEGKMEELKARKQALVAGILGGESGASLKMSADDIEALFAPMQ